MVFTFDLKISKEKENFIKEGRLFQSLGAAVEKALSPGYYVSFITVVSAQNKS